MQTVIRSTKHRRTFACLLLLVVVSSSLFPKTGNAEATSPWLTPSPSFKKLGVIDDVSQSMDMIGNHDCLPAEVVVRPAKIIPYQTKESHDDCIVDTSFGAVSNSGYLQRQGSDAFGWVTWPGGKTALLGAPRSNNGLAVTGNAPHGTYVSYFDNLENLVSSTKFNGLVTHVLPVSPSATVADHDGNFLPLDLTTLGFSSEGDWAVVESPGIAMLRINLYSHMVLPFGDAPIFDSTTPAYRTAISADGRYAVVISKTRDMFKLYDLSTCSAIPNHITGPVTCNSVDIISSVKSKVQDYLSTASVRFASDYSLELYVNTSAGLVHEMISAAGQDGPEFQYLALGDSFASGEGAFQYKSLSDTTSNGCHVSLRSYPYLISRELHLSQSESVACSGATIDDLTNNKADYRQNHAQSKGKEDASFDESILAGFLPGYRAQKLFSKKYKPVVETVSIGGNDIGFSDILVRCLGIDTCYATYEDRLEVLNEINGLFDRLSGLYTELKHSSPSTEKLYVVAYPQLVDPNGNCALNVHLNYNELLFANLLVMQLNSVIKAAAEKAGVTYLDTEEALFGHRLCETNSNHVAVNGLSIGNDILNFPYIHGPIAKESYHPNNLGHELLKSKILELADNFSILNKPPKPTKKLPETNPDSEILKAPKTGRTVKKTIHKKSTGSSTVKKNIKRTATTKGAGSIFKPGSVPKVVLDDNGSNVGMVSQTPDGDLVTEITIPDSTPPGPHTVDVVGDNTSDEPTKVTETIVVDNDTSNECGVFAASGVDADHDGVDDSCDSLIDSGNTSGSNNPPADQSQNSAMQSSNSANEVLNNPGSTQTTPQPQTTNLGASALQSVPLSTLGLAVASQNIPSLISPDSYQPTSGVIAQSAQSPGPTSVLSAATKPESSPFGPAAFYAEPKRLDFVRPVGLLLILLVTFLFIAVLMYRRRRHKYAHDHP